MTGRPTIDAEALAAALAERARAEAAGAGAARAASGGPAAAPPETTTAEPDPEELLDYLAGRLDPERARRVERRLVADPAAARALLDLAELEAAGRESGGAAGAEGGAGSGSGGRPPADLAVEAGWRELRGRLAAESAPARRSAPRAPWYLAAALGILALGLGDRVITLQQELGRPAAITATLDLYSGTRAGAAGPTVAAAPGERVLVSIEAPAACERYEAAIERAGSAGRLVVEDLTPGAGLLAFHWSPEPGAYTLTLSGCDPPRELEAYPFTVARPASGRPGDDG